MYAWGVAYEGYLENLLLKGEKYGFKLGSQVLVHIFPMFPRKYFSSGFEIRLTKSEVGKLDIDETSPRFMGKYVGLF